MKTTKSLARTTAVLGALAVTGGLLATTSTTAHAAEWKQAKGVSPMGALPADARIAVAPDGDAAAVWRVKTGNFFRIAVAKRVANGAWSTQQVLSSATQDSYWPDVAINSDGDAVASWRTFDGDKLHLHAAINTSGSWQVKTLGPADESVGETEIAIDGAGTVFAVWTIFNDLTRSATIPAGQATLDGIVSFEPATALGLDVTAAGQATVVWAEDAGEESNIRSASWTKSQGTPPETIDTEVLVGDISVAVNRHGVADAAYSIQNGDQGRFVTVVRRVAGQWGFPDTVSFNGDDSIAPAVGIDDNHKAVVAWRTLTGELMAAGRGPVGEFGEPRTLTLEGVNNDPLVDVNGRGDAIIQYATAGALHTFVRSPGTVFPDATLGFTQAQDITGPLATSNRGIGLDGQGNLATLFGYKVTPETGRVLETIYDMAGPVSKVTKPGSPRINTTSVPVAWSATDRYSAIESFDVNVRVAPWNGGFGELTTLNHDTSATSRTVSGKAGRTYCFAVSGRDSASNQGELSGYRCTTTPLDDRQPSLTGTWTNQTGSAHYRGTVRTTTRHGATMKLTGVKVEKLGLLVAKGKGYGSIAVYFNGTKLGTYSLAASKSKAKQQIFVKDFGQLKTGTVLIKVTSANGKPVKIDGLHLQQRLVLAK